MFGIGKLKKQLDELESNFNGLSKVAHDHKALLYQGKSGDWAQWLTVSQACELMLEKQKQNDLMRQELDTFHAHWAKQECDNCVHLGICKKTIKYGEECTDRMDS